MKFDMMCTLATTRFGLRGRMAAVEDVFPARANVVAACERHQERTVEAALGAELDVFDAGLLAQVCGPGAGFVALLAAQDGLAVEQQAEPFFIG
jgi:hypothetical protein